jgi:hypothetical protein
MDEFEARAVHNLCVMADVDPSAEVARIIWTIEDVALAWVRENVLTGLVQLDKASALQFKDALVTAEFADIEDRSIERGWDVLEGLVSNRYMKQFSN